MLCEGVAKQTGGDHQSWRAMGAGLQGNTVNVSNNAMVLCEPAQPHNEGQERIYLEGEQGSPTHSVLACSFESLSE